MLLLLSLACRPVGRDSPVDRPLDSRGDSPSESPADSPPDSPPDSPVLPIELELIGVDEQAYEGLVLQEWEAADFLGWDGQPTSFLLLAPEGGGELGLLLLLHGSVAVDDSLQPSRCSRDDLVFARARMMEEWQVLPWQAAAQGYAVLAPMNPWCDLWLGQGEADPVDTHHRGFELIEHGLSWLEDSDQHGLSITGTRLVWGTSTGSIGAAQVLARRDDFTGGVLDSGPVDFSDTTQPSYIEAVDHVIGDDASWRAQVDPVALAAAGGLGGRVLQLGNDQDTVTSPSHLRAFEAALATGHGGGWLSWDLDHPSPWPTHHVQGGLRPMPFPYFSLAALDWVADGGDAVWLEAESCLDCAVGKASTGAGWAESAWSGVVRLAEAGDLPGELARFELPEGVPASAPVQASVVLGLPGEGEANSLDLVELRWVVEGETVASKVVNGLQLDAGELASIDGHLAATQLALPPRAEGQGATLEVIFQGGAVVLVDAALLRW